MTDDALELTPKAPHQVNGPSNNRMVIAFPFSAVKINDPDENVAELAALLAELAGLVAATVPGPEADDLAQPRPRPRAEARALTRTRPPAVRPCSLGARPHDDRVPVNRLRRQPVTTSVVTLW